MQNTLIRWTAVFVGLALPAMVFAVGGGSTDSGPMPSAREQTPQEIARSAYNDGVRAVKQAKKHDDDVAEATRDDKKAKAVERARKQYEKARGYFALAVTKQPAMHEAWNYIGYTSRKLGEHDKALAAYDEALRLKPAYAEAIEYRGVAYLGLNRLADAKNAYMTLFRDNRKLADELMLAMQQWVTERRASGTASADVDAFAQWLSERTTVAQQTASLATDAPASAWK